MLRSLVDSILHHRLIVVVVGAILLVFGVQAARKLSVDAFPDVTNVQVQIATEAAGRSPEEVERFVTVPIEIAMTGIPRLTEMRSLIKPGLSIVTLVFEDGTDVYLARQLVMERLAEARGRLPENVTPVLGPVSSALGEVYQYTLEHPDDGERPLSKAELTERRIVQDWVVRPLLRSIPGVAEINSTGGYVRQYQVLPDPMKLRSYDVTLNDVTRALYNNNSNSGGGILPQGAEQYLVRGVGLIQSLDDIRNIILKEVSNTPVYLRDVAEVRFGEEVRYGAMVKGGYTEAVGGIVMMIAGGNAKEIVGRVQARVEEINSRGMLPDGYRIVPYYDRSELVDAALWTVSKVLMEGIVLVVIVLFLFLGDLRSSIIVIATLILTPLATFIIMNHVGLSANLMSLGGLAIAIGLMVDGSVVVVENVFEKLSHGPPANRLRTILDAVLEVGTPVIFGITVIILVFLPLMTLEGMEGKMFSPLAYTIAIALGISLVLSLTLSPVLSAYLLKGSGEHDTILIRVLKRPFSAVLGAALRNEKRTIATALVLFAASISLFPLLGTSFIPEMREGSISPNIDRVPNISLDEAIVMEMKAMRIVSAVPGVRKAVSRLGRGESPADAAGPNEADVMASLVPPDERPDGLTQDAIADEIRKRLAVIPGVNLVMSQPISDRVDEMVTGVRADVAVKLFGDDLDVLVEKASQIAKVASGIRGMRDTRVDRVGGQQYLSITINRQAIARQGLNASDVHEMIETAIGGRIATEVYEGERRFNAVVRYPEHLRNSIGEIRHIILRSPTGSTVMLENLADIRVVEGPAQINRDMGKRRIVVGVNLQDRDLGGFVAELQQKIGAEVELPPGYYIEWGGQFQNMQRARLHLIIIVPITIGAIFFLLFLLFHSVRFAVLIILVLPFASIGGIVALFVSGEYLSVPASVGFIALWGIAVLNGVVLVSYIRKLRQSGIAQREAIVQGTLQRFRPVMMTATVAALGLVPFLFATGPGSEVQRPLAVVVIGGLITSTLLTLVVVPTLYRFFDHDGSGVEEAQEAA
ncbi:MAG: CusA/CzcA family heavy metal efflux RND transporter [Bryobacteraceae bacterium]|nr:efflux RND transporter permease subunit [Solibacteraceae bacterium]MCO5353876.1 CusA/CzcA family heavy metal efflux RND transporter [Bryobacteraceae bacterium]